jgi:hypothetical protein
LTTCGLHILSEAVAILVHLKFSYIIYFLFDEKALLINSRLPYQEVGRPGIWAFLLLR